MVTFCESRLLAAELLPRSTHSRPGQVLAISFPTFTPQLTIQSERELTVEIVAGEGTGFADTVEYEAVTVREDLVVLSWQEHIGSTIVHVLDFRSSRAHTAVTPASGGFLRLTGPIEVRPGGREGIPGRSSG